MKRAGLATEVYGPDMLVLFLPVAAAADLGVVNTVVEHQGAEYSVVTVDPSQPGLELRLYGGRSGGIRLEEAVEQARLEDLQVVAATNAGMFHQGYGPVGLFVDRGVEYQAVTTGDGPGNFFLKPNGVFWVDKTGVARVWSTEMFTLHPQAAWTATQSGPMLVTNGEVHPAFRGASSNFLLRSGVGVSGDGRVHFAISETGVRFHDFATLFRDVLGCPNALYLDGTISMLWAGAGPMPGGRFSGVLAVTTPSRKP